jgi:predicted CXXCH cytochrome family protein
MYYLIRRKTGGGASEALDTEYDVTKLTLGDGLDATVHMVGLRDVLEIEASGGGGAKFKAGKLDCSVNGKAQSKGSLAVGDTIEVPGFTLEVFAAPQGFDFALEITTLKVADEAMFGTHLDIDSAGWSLRTTAWLLAALVLVVALILPGLGLFSPEMGATMRSSALPDDNLWSSGPLVAAHRTAGITTDCQACHTTPFVMVEDKACLACHRDMKEHVDLAGHDAEMFTETRCGSCHREHNEPGQIVQRDKGLCVDCHADSETLKLDDGNPLMVVEGFTQESHPEFRLSLLQPQGPGGAHGWAENRVRMSDAPLGETSNLKFTHTLHLDADKVVEEDSGEALVCASCHTLKDDGEHFEPITMDNHCRSCHSLGFDSFDPAVELPHGNLRSAIVAMEAHFIREFTDPELRAQRGSTKSRRMPGKRESAATCEGNGLDCGRAEALKEAEYQFANTGCITCHVVLDTGSKEILDRWFVQPIRITNNWYVHSRFDHSSHLSQLWDEPREICESCHEASTSDVSSDILIPGRENCLECHAEDSGRSVAVDCVSCHVFHLDSATESSTARMMEGKP